MMVTLCSACHRSQSQVGAVRPPMSHSPYDLRIDSGGDQFAVSGATPRLSWKLPPGSARQTGFELEAAVDGDTRAATNRRCAQHLYVPWPWTALRSRQRVAWRVRVTDDAGTAAGWSDWNTFEAGLFDEDWQARWISPVETEDPGYG